MDEDWEKITQYLVSKLNMPESIVEYIAVVDIIELAVSGFSNSSIARRLDFDEEYIRQVNGDFLGFEGYEVDLSFNPYSAFRRSINLEDFKYEVNLIVHPLDNSLEICYNTCIKFDNIRKELDEYYGNS